MHRTKRNVVPKCMVYTFILQSTKQAKGTIDYFFSLKYNVSGDPIMRNPLDKQLYFQGVSEAAQVSYSSQQRESGEGLCQTFSVQQEDHNRLPNSVTQKPKEDLIISNHNHHSDDHG
ncbi:hypothetical protein ACOSP7_026602 [Xanthoceras sorbifolium]